MRCFYWISSLILCEQRRYFRVAVPALPPRAIVQSDLTKNLFVIIHRDIKLWGKVSNDLEKLLLRLFRHFGTVMVEIHPAMSRHIEPHSMERWKARCHRRSRLQLKSIQFYYFLSCRSHSPSSVSWTMWEKSFDIRHSFFLPISCAFCCPHCKWTLSFFTTALIRQLAWGFKWFKWFRLCCLSFDPRNWTRQSTVKWSTAENKECLMVTTASFEKLTIEVALECIFEAFEAK